MRQLVIDGSVRADNSILIAAEQAALPIEVSEHLLLPLVGQSE